MRREQIGKRIGQLRRERKLSREQFGKMVGVSGQHLGSIEKGKNGLSLKLIVQICNTTGASADYILFGIVYSAQELATAAELDGLSGEQLEIGLDIIRRLARFINTEGGNETLIQEIMRRQPMSR